MAISGDNALHHVPDAVLVEPAVHPAKAEQLSASRFARLLIFMGLRRNSPRGLLGESALIFRRQNLAGHRGGRLHHQPTDLALELGEHAVMVSGGGFACTDRDLFAAAMAFWVCCSRTRAAAARA